MVRTTPLLAGTGSAPGANRALLPAAGLTAALLAAWDALAGRLPDLPDGWDVAILATFVLPATFMFVWLLLPLASWRRLVFLALATAAFAVLLDLAGLDAAFNVAKLTCFAFVGFCLLRLFETLSWVVLVAALIPWVDIASLYRGPTKELVEEEPGTFERIAVAFSVPGEDGAAHVGPPDFVFFALFLAAADRFGLRVTATWLGMTGAVSATLVATSAFDLDALPALPAIALGFLVPNADLLWQALRGGHARAAEP